MNARGRGCLLVLPIAALATGAASRADVVDFLPVATWNELLIDLSAFREEDELTGPAGRETWEDTYTKERLVLGSLGFFYHPRFIQYDVTVGVALKQELYESSEVEFQGHRTAAGWDHDVKLFVLPEHPYNVTVFSTRYEPVYREQAAIARDSVERNRGATFRYRNRPWFLDASFLDSVIDTSVASSEVQKASANGEYFRQLDEEKKLSFFAGADRSRFLGEGDLHGVLSEFHVGNLLDFTELRLSSDVSGTGFEQQGSASGGIDSTNLTWHERLNLLLPWRLQADVSYRYRRSESTFDPLESPRRSLFDRASELDARLSHRLYDSLESKYMVLGARHSSSGGTSTALSHGLSADYSKKIPRGLVLAGLSFGTGRTDSEGRGADVIDELHGAIAVPTQTFDLAQTLVIEESIALFLRSPLPPNEAILLQRDVHYTVAPVPERASFEIHVLVLPPQFAVPGVYDFLVSYALGGGDFGTRTDTYAGNVRVELLDNLLTPFASYVVVSSEVVDGIFPGDPIDSTSTSVGLRVRRGIVGGVAEHVAVDTEVRPYEAWRFELQLSGGAGRSTTVHASASREDRRYGEGTLLLDPGNDTERRESATGSIQQQLFDRSLTLSLGGTWARIRGPYESDAYSGTTSLTFRVGRLDVSAGASISRASTSGAETFLTERDHASYYVRIKRTIF